MDKNSARRMGKQPYEAFREQFDQLGERVIERHWDEDAPVRQGYRRFLGAMDELAGRLLDDDEIAQRGQDLLRESEAEEAARAGDAGEAEGAAARAGASGDAGTDAAEGTGMTGEAEGAGEDGAASEAGETSGTRVTDEAGAGSRAGAGSGAGAAGVTGEAEAASGAGAAGATRGPDEAAGGAVEEGDDSVWTQAADEAEAADGQAADEVRRTDEAHQTEEALRADEAGVGEAWAAGNARIADAQAAGVTSEPAATETERTVDVVFSLPAETQAERVALCGEFNDWSLDGISLVRGVDRAWRVTVPLTPGTYRYKFLLDGETWENATDADRYEDNAYGTQDSVIVVTE